MKKYSRVRAEISFDAIDNNFDVIESVLSKDTSICAVIKADCYGHGAVPIARRIARRKRVWGFACATAEEAIRLRVSGIFKPILILGYSFPEMYDELIGYDIRPCICDFKSAKMLSERAVKSDHAAKIHIALDTGMSRIGFSCDDEAVETILKIAALPGIKIEGLFSHFARADEADERHSARQMKKYSYVAAKLEEAGLDIPVKHIANSAATMRFPDYHHSMVRTGIIMYGLMPSDEMADELKALKPVLRLTSHVTYIKTLPAGVAISYGGTYKTKEESVIATIPVGYADGYPRSLSNKGYVLIRSRRAPIRGRVCMDQMMVDVTDIPDVAVGDEVVLIGPQGEDSITAEELGKLSGRFNYELICDISMRVPRSYTHGGRVVEQVDYLQ